MTSSLSREFFSTAQQEYLRSRTWARVALAVALVAHVLTISPYLVARGVLVRSELVRSQLAGAVAALDEFHVRLVALLHTFDSEVEQQLDTAREELREDFADLDRQISSIREITPPPTTEMERPEQSGYDANEEDDSELAFDFPPELVKQLRETRGPETEIKPLRAFIEKEVVGRRFQELDRSWHAFSAVSIAAAVDRVVEAANALEHAAPDLDKLGEEARAHAIDLGAKASSLVLRAPDAGDWWKTYAGKVASFASLKQSASQYVDRIGLAGVIADGSDLDRARSDLSAQLLVQEQRRAEIDLELKSLEARWIEQKARLASIGKPFEFIPVDLEFVATRLPLLLGLLLAAALAWPGVHLAEAAWAAWRLRREKDSAAWAWVRTQVSSAATASSPNLQLVRWTLRAALLPCLWIGVATAQVLWTGSSGTQVVGSAVAGAVLVLVGAGYRASRLRSMLAPGLREIEETPA